MTFKFRSCLFAVILLVFMLLPLISFQPASAATYTVTFTADNTTAGSLRYAITEANKTSGPHTINFSIPRSDPGFYSENATHGWWIIRLNSALPAINKPHIYIDGTTQTINQGDTNPGKVGTGGTVGTDNVVLHQYDRPEIEITPATISTVSSGLVTSADNTTVRSLAIYGFGGTGASITNAQVRLTGGNNVLLENCLLGSRANGTDPGFDSKTAGIYISSAPTGTVRNNYIAFNIMGIYFQGAHNFLITGNEIFKNALRNSSYDGLDMASGTNNITVRGNYIWQNGGTGIDSYNATGQLAIENNTVTSSGAAGGSEKCGMRLFGAGSQVSKNIVFSNAGAGIIVPPLFGTIYSENITLSQNSCYSNGGLGIDLIRVGGSRDYGDGVNYNDGIYVLAWGDRGLDFPILTSSTLAGDILNISGYIGTDNTSATFRNSKLEFFKAATDPTGYGEGRTYLGAHTMISADNSFSCTIDVNGKGLLSTDSITATATDPAGNTSEFCLCRQLSVVQNPVLSLSVTPPAYGYAGQNVTYSGAVRNVSTSTAYNNVLTWQLPNEFTYVSSSGGTYNLVTRAVTISVPTITAGQEITGYVTVQINPGVPDGTVVTTGSILTWQNQLGNPLGPVNHSSSIVVYSTPQLTTQLFPPGYAFSGENILYTGVLHNYSSGTAVNTVLTFQLPGPQMSFVSASRAAVISGDNVTFNLGSITPNTDMSGSMTVHIDASTPDGTVLHLTTLLSWQDAAGNSYGPQERYYDLTIYQRPQLTITKEGPPEAVIGSNYTFTGTLANVGSGQAENAVLVDYLPAGLTFVSSSHSAVYNSTDRTVTWQLGRISSGSSIPGWINVLVDNTTINGSHLINNFQATWSDNLSNPYGPVSTSREIIAYSSPQLTITKEGPDEATVGSYITFTGTVTNVGGLPAENTVLVDYLPTGLSFVGSSHGAVYDPAMRTVTWQLGHVDSGVAMPGWITVQVDSSVTNGSRLTNNFAVTWQDGGGNSFGPANANKQVIARTNPLLSISKTGPEYGRPGNNLTFTISLANFGGLNAQDITLVDTLPDKYSYVSSNPAGAYSGGNVIWSLGSLAPGASTFVSLTVLVDNTTANNTPLANGAIVTWKDSPGNTFGPTSTSFTTTIYAVPHLLVSKSGPHTANPGDNCTYTIMLTNISDAAALNTTLNDILPTGMSFVSCSDGGTYNIPFGMVTWDLGTVAGNSSRQVSITLRVDPSLIQETSLTDSAAVIWKDSLGNDYGPAVGNFSTLVSPFPELSISITGPASGQSGIALTFTVIVTNSSNTMMASNVFAQFIIPSGCTYNSSSNGGSYAAGTVTWNLGSLAAMGSRQFTIITTPSTAPVGSDVISTSATVWQYPSGSIHGPRFAAMNTRIEAAPPTPPPPPPAPTYTLPPPVTPHSSATVSTLNNPPPMQLPYIYIESASISTFETEPNSPVLVTATVANKGTVNGSAKIRLYVNGYEEPGQAVMLASGQSRTLTFDVSRSEPGTYQVYVNGTSAGSFKISDNFGNNVILVISSLCLLGALFIAILMALRRKQSYS